MATVKLAILFFIIFTSCPLTAGDNVNSIFLDKSFTNEFNSCDLQRVSKALDKTLDHTDDSLFDVWLQTLPVRLYQVGRKDESVFWFTIYQLRQRYSIALNHQNVDPKIRDGVAYYIPINNYARQDIDKYLAIVKKAMEWDKTHENPISKSPKYQQLVPRLQSIQDEFLQEKNELLKYKNEWEESSKSLSDKVQDQAWLGYSCKN